MHASIESTDIPHTNPHKSEGPSPLGTGGVVANGTCALEDRSHAAPAKSAVVCMGISRAFSVGDGGSRGIADARAVATRRERLRGCIF